MRTSAIRRIAAGLLSCLAAGACEETFAPIEESDLQFSIFGYLDASADTQWIRVMPIRPLVLTSGAPLDATVTIEELGTDRIIELRDSAFRYGTTPEVGSDGFFLHNFWTAERIAPDARYRFTATSAGGVASEAVVATPPEYGVAIRTDGSQLDHGDLLRLEGVSHVAFVRMTTHYHDTCGDTLERAFFGTGNPQSDVQLIPIDRRFRGRNACGLPLIERRELLVVGSAAEWPAGDEYSTFGLGVPDAASNVSNSLGFLGGVLTRSMLYPECRIDGVGPPAVECSVEYDDAAARLRGTVTDAWCGGAPVLLAMVELREVEPGTSGGHLVRTTSTPRSGAFEIQGIEPGRRYALNVRRFVPNSSEQFAEYADSIVFAPGEQVVHDVPLRRLQCR